MGNAGSSPPFMLIILILTGISFCFFGWITFAVLAVIFMVMTIGTMIHDYFYPPAPFTERVYYENNEEDKYSESDEDENAIGPEICKECGGEMKLIKEGSPWLFRCKKCGWEFGGVT